MLLLVDRNIAERMSFGLEEIIKKAIMAGEPAGQCTRASSILVAEASRGH